MNATMTYTHNRRTNPAVFLFFFVLIGIAMIIAVPMLFPATPSRPTVKVPEIIESVHADNAHGVWAERARNACKQHGASQIWQQKTDGRYHFVCFDPTFGWLDWIVEKIDGTWQEITAFQPKDGSLSSIVNWIKPKGVKWIDLNFFKTTLR